MSRVTHHLSIGIALALGTLSAAVVAQPRQAPGETSVSVGVTGLKIGRAHV